MYIHCIYSYDLFQCYDDEWFRKAPEVPYGYFEAHDDWLTVKSLLKKEKRNIVFVSKNIFIIIYYVV